jgi:hypothetical protein
MIMVEMDVHAGQDDVLKAMLNIRQLTGQITDVVIVDECNRPNRLLVFIPLLADQIVADQIPQGLRSIRIFFPCDVAIEIAKEMVVKGDAEADDLFHSVTNK